MLPHTHFLFGLLLGLIGFKYNYFSIESVLLIGILAVFIDIDHFISFHKHHKSWNIKNCWNSAIIKHEHLRTFIHHKEGILSILGLLVILAVFNLKFGIILGLAYFSHIFLDKIHLAKEKIRKHRFKRLFGFFIPISYSEIIFDVLLIFMIILLL